MSETRENQEAGPEHAEEGGVVVDRTPLHGTRHTRTTPDGTGERVDLPVTGMTCAACARRIETKLGRAPGVQRAAVNFATSRATVEYDPTSTGTRALIGVVEDVGYGIAGTARADFVVDDSARPSGSARPLEKHLARIPGVVSATFNLGVMEVRVEYLPGATAGGVQEVQITVKGGYAPDVVVVRAGQPVRLDFYRDETASCSEQVVFGDFGIARDLPAYQTTPIEFTPHDPGEFTWTCGMNMMRGKLIVEDPSPDMVT